jgi:threonyl-tRNA synthetase
MRESQTRKIPYTLVIGDKEVEGRLVNYRKHGSNETISISIEDFVKLIKEQINNYK